MIPEYTLSTLREIETTDLLDNTRAVWATIDKVS
jgi:hypothetical protein